MASAITFDWLREGKPADRFEITPGLRSPGTIYRHVKKNGMAYVPEGTHFTIELPPSTTSKHSEATKVKSHENTTSLKTPSALKPPDAKPTVPPLSAEPTSSPPWHLIVALIVTATGLLWLVRQKRS